MRLLRFALGVILCVSSTVFFAHSCIYFAGMVYRLGLIGAVKTILGNSLYPLILGGSLAIGAVFLFVGVAILVGHGKSEA
jgi:hypothetical protein